MNKNIENNQAKLEKKYKKGKAKLVIGIIIAIIVLYLIVELVRFIQFQNMINTSASAIDMIRTFV